MAAALFVAICSLLVPAAAQGYYSTPYLSVGTGDVYVNTNDGLGSASQPELVGYHVIPDEQDNSLQSEQLPAAFLGALNGLLPQQSLLPKQGSGYTQQQHSGYQSSSSYSSQPSSGGYGQSNKGARSGYGHKKKKQRVKKEKVYVPVPIKKPRRKKKKKKLLSVSKGFYVQGGAQLFGKFKTLKSCQKACENTGSCFAGDYDKWTKRCFVHTNSTACASRTARKGIVHFKKVPCTLNEIGLNFARITLGANLDFGLLQKGIKDIQTCIRKCATSGGGLLAQFTVVGTPGELQLANVPQICFGIDYDFSSHKCYFHVAADIFTTDAGAVLDATPNVRIGNPGGIRCYTQEADASLTQPLGAPNLIANPSTVNVILCPRPLAAG